MKLEAQGAVLSARNAILRAICGIALHGALDQAPYYLLGGSGNGAALKIGQLVQWMSAADSLRTGGTFDAIAPGLEAHLQSRAFLIGSSQPSLADYDLALAIDGKAIDAAVYPSIQRWYAASIFAFQQHSKGNVSVPVSAPAASTGPLTFYYGLEDVSTILKPPAAPKPKAEPKQAAGGAPKEKQAEQPKNENKGKQKNAGGNKGGGKQQQPAAAAAVDISALDIRVGKIVKAWHHETADKLFCEEIDLGTETRQIASGLRPFYKTEDLEGRVVLVLCNLKKRNLVGFPSHGMVLCASNADHTKVEFVVPAEGSKPGDRVMFEGFDGEPEPENKVAKKKIFEGLAPDLKTDAEGQVMWKTTLAKTEAGVVKALNGMPGAHVS
uniref:tRNA-binding domain-containing protein n=1 Tax=Entomoneis paludosa TaxID=265537 RepID=A0A7S2YRW0_9STRA